MTIVLFGLVQNIDFFSSACSISWDPPHSLEKKKQNLILPQRPVPTTSSKWVSKYSLSINSLFLSSLMVAVGEFVMWKMGFEGSFTSFIHRNKLQYRNDRSTCIGHVSYILVTDIR